MGCLLKICVAPYMGDLLRFTTAIYANTLSKWKKQF